MFTRNKFVALIIAVCCVSIYALPAEANKKSENWERGCNDAKQGTYNQSRHGDEYQKGWNACKINKPNNPITMVRRNGTAAAKMPRSDRTTAACTPMRRRRLAVMQKSATATHQ